MIQQSLVRILIVIIDFSPYYSYLYSFIGIHGIMRNNEYEQDSVMVYQKKKDYERGMTNV